jgi:hypothetical protein
MTIESHLKALLGEAMFNSAAAAARVDELIAQVASVTKERDDALAALEQAMKELTAAKGAPASATDQSIG